MSPQLQQLCAELTKVLQDTYEEGTTLEHAEKLAAKFLHAQVLVSQELCEADLDARMRKAGVKAVRAAVYLDKAKEGDRKPSDVMLEAYINSDKLVAGEQEGFDVAEVQRDQLQHYFNVFNNAHIFYRGVSRGKFE